MNKRLASGTLPAASFVALLRGDADATARWLDADIGVALPRCLAIIVLGSGLYGATLGLWRSPQQAVFVAVKLPLLLALTCAGNALLNGILAQGLGARLSFRQTALAILFSFVLASTVLGALSPVMLFLLSNTPPLTAGREARLGHAITMVAHVGVIAMAGIIGNARLLRVLRQRCPDAATARRVLVAWLAGNLLLGSQLAWVLRPFVGSPGLVVEFLRADPLRGNFFETLARACRQLFSP